ncbi:MAG: CRISPR-associated endonuclease Cas3'', partial [Proteobacteria bacterium]|nr:CRISPR-associated endonuclease Cas3'' [Pseudomonadota bacterium]
MAGPFYAHSLESKDRAHWQPLPEHLVGVGDLAAANGAAARIGDLARMAGLLHDLGKFDPDFQARLAGSKAAVDHSTAGAYEVRRLAGVQKIMAELIAYTIAGHHAGLPDGSGSQGALTERLSGFNPARLAGGWRETLDLPAGNLVPAWLKPPEDYDRTGFRLAMLGRMIFSCLVDADFRDTEAFYAGAEGRKVDRAWPALADILPALRERFDTFMDGKSTSPGPINTLRAQILAEVRGRAGMEPGFFTLTVPTGGGKTLASLGFALDHAARHGKRRIICAIPYTSIIDQTAAIFREVLETGGEQIVLEHHSSIEIAAGQESGEVTRAVESRRRLAMEDWAAPVIATTNVQLFESLFASRPGRARKLHNIAQSVIILDEAQTLPRNLLIPAVWALRELVECYGCSVVLCTATQPALEASRFPLKPGARPHKLGLPLKGRELAPDPATLAAALKRVTIRHGGAMSDEALLEELSTQPNGLVIVNSRRHALALFRAGQAAGLEGMVHLTTRQYAAHRRAVLADIRQRLQAGLPCRLIATSLIEAGVDVDFARVWRAESGLDQIIQAAGRCNREGRRRAEESIVTIFEPAGYKPFGEIGQLAEALNRVRMRPGEATPLDSLDAMERYFHEVYWAKGEEGLDTGSDGARITPRFSFSNQTGVSLAYRSVAGAFRMVEEGMEPVIVARDPEAKALVDKLGIPDIPSGALARGLQSYIVQVTPRDRAALIEAGHVRFAETALRAEQFAVLQSPAHYSDAVG